MPEQPCSKITAGSKRKRGERDSPLPRMAESASTQTDGLRKKLPPKGPSGKDEGSEKKGHQLLFEDSDDDWDPRAAFFDDFAADLELLHDYTRSALVLVRRWRLLSREFHQDVEDRNYINDSELTEEDTDGHESDD